MNKRARRINGVTNNEANVTVAPFSRKAAPVTSAVKTSIFISVKEDENKSGKYKKNNSRNGRHCIII